jgi:hypothetical protein
MAHTCVLAAHPSQRRAGGQKRGPRPQGRGTMSPSNPSASWLMPAVKYTLLGGVGWLVASDHAGYLLRRRYGAQMRARLSRWQPKGPAHKQLLASLHMLAGDSRRVAATSYPVFALLNAGNASVWGSTFVGAGYLLAALWYGGRTSWSSVALVLASSAAILTVALTARHRRHAGTKGR